MGADAKACAFCGAHAAEAHHAFGRAIDPDTAVPLCRPHHEDVHTGLRDARVDLRHATGRTILDRIEGVLRAAAVLLDGAGEVLEMGWLVRLGQGLSHWADEAAEFRDQLTRAYPDWHLCICAGAS